MRPIQTFDPTASTTGTIDTRGVNKNEQLLLYNNSPVALLLSFQDGTTDVLPPNWGRDYVKPTIAMDKITWKQLFTLVGVGTFNNTVYGTLYESGEHVAPVNSSLGFGNVAVAQATSVVNTNSPPATPIVFAEPVGDTNANGATNLNNQGQLSLGDPTYNGSIAILGTDTANLDLARNAVNAFDALGHQTLSMPLTSPPSMQLTDDAGNSFQFGPDLGISIGAGIETVVNGTAGNFTKMFPIWGASLKIMVIVFAGYSNTVTVSVPFPSNMGRGLFFVGGLGGSSFTLSSGSVAVITTLGTASAAGSEAAAGTVRGDSFGYIQTSVSGIVIGTATTQQGCIVFIGN